MNTNDTSTPIAKGRCDLKPIPTVESLQARVQELEAAARSKDEWKKYLEDWHHGTQSVIGLAHWNLKQANDLGELSDHARKAFELISAFKRTAPRSPLDRLLEAANPSEVLP